MAEEHNAELVRRAVGEIWNEGVLDVADELFAADYVNHAGLIPDLVRGPEAIKISVILYRTAFPSFQISVDELTAEQDMVVLRWTARRAPLTSPVPQGVQDTLTGVLVSRCAGGKIMESWTSWDQVGVLARLGLVERPGPVQRMPTPAG